MDIIITDDILESEKLNLSITFNGYQWTTFRLTTKEMKQLYLYLCEFLKDKKTD